MKYFNKEFYLKSCIEGCIDSNITAAYNKEYNSFKEKLPEWYNEEFTVHDLKIIGVEAVSKDENTKQLILKFDCSGGFMQIDSLTFVNYKIIEDTSLVNTWCIGDEIYVNSDGKFEYHLLIDNPDCYVNGDKSSRLFYFTVVCYDILFNRTD